MTINVNGLFLGEIKPDATVAGCIDLFENAWPNPEETISTVEKEVQRVDSKIYWEKAGTIGDGVHQSARTNELLAVSHLANVANNSICQNIHNQFYTLLLASTNPYAVRYGINEPFFHEGYSLLKYANDQQYKAHYDGGTEIGRCVSALVYLNADFVGGELEFPHFGVKIAPQPGLLVLFPSNFAYKHIAHPVVKGTKYALVTWIKDRPL
jgi:predicted 2-oxoglutarate/Fe(II)-dependent dioxygenase YbiX